jgi:uncharacterized protein (TIGR00369 family)
VTTLQPRDPDWDAKVRASFARQPFAHLVGFHLERLEPGFAEFRLPLRDEVTQQHGFAHGGAIATIADNAASYAAFSMMPPGSAPLTVEMKLNWLAPGRGEALIARGQVLKAGRTLVPAEAKVYALDNGEETLVAQALVTVMCMAGRDDAKRPG